MPISDILHCSKSEVEHLVLQSPTSDDSRWFRSKGIGAIELAQLGEMLSVATCDDLMEAFDELGDFNDFDAGDTSVQPFPPAFVHRLASIDDASISTVAVKWATIDEFGGDERPELLIDYLRQLRTFLADRTGDFFLIESL